MATEEQVRLGLDTTPAQAGAQAFESAVERVIGTLGQLDSRVDRVEKSSRVFARSNEFLAVEMRSVSRAIGHQNAALQSLGGRLQAVATSIQQSSASLAQNRAQLDRHARSVRTSDAGLRQLGARVRSVGVLFAGGFGLRAAITSLRDFELEMAKVRAVTRASVQDLEAVRNEALRLGATTEFTNAQVAAGAVALSRAGFDAAEVVDTLGSALDLATAGELGLAEAAGITANTLRQYSLPTLASARATNTLVEVTNNANTDIRQLGEAMKYAGPLASALGVDLEESGAAMGALADRGVKASLAGTNLRGVLIALRSPTQEALKEFRDAGANVERLDTTTTSFVDVARELKRAFDGGADAATIFGRRNAAAALILADSATKIAELEQRARTATDSAGEFAGVTRDTLNGSLKALQSSLEAATQRAGDNGLLGALRGLTDLATETVRKVAGLEDGVERFGVATDIAAIAVETLSVRLAAGAILRLATSIGAGTRAMVGFGTAATAASNAVGTLTLASRITPWVTAIAAAGFGLAALRRHLQALPDDLAALDETTSKVEQIEQRFGGLAARLSPKDQQDPSVLGDLSLERAGAARAISEKVRDLRGGEIPALQFPSLKEYLADLDAATRKHEAWVDALERTPAVDPTIGRRDAGGPGVDRSAIERATEMARIEREALEQQPVRIGAGEAAQTFVRPELFSLAQIAKDTGPAAVAELEAALQASAVEGRLSLEVIDRLALRWADLNVEAAEVRKTLSDAPKPEDVSEFVDSLRAPFQGDLAQLEEQRRILEQVQAGTLDLAVAMERISEVEAVRKAELEARAAAEKQGIALTEQDVAALRLDALAAFQANRANEELAASLQARADATRAATDRAEQFVDGLRSQVDELEVSSGRLSREESLLRQLSAILPETAEGYDELAARVREYAAILESAERKGGGRAGEPYSRVQRQVDAQRELLAGLQLQAQELGLTRLETEKLAIAERLRLQGATADTIRLAEATVELIDQRRRLREATDAVGEGLAEGVRQLVREGATLREAAAAALDSISSRILDQSLEQLSDQFSTGLFNLVAPEAPSIDLQAPEDSGVAAAVTSGTTAVVGAIGSSTSAIVAALQGSLQGPPIPTTDSGLGSSSPAIPAGPSVEGGATVPDQVGTQQIVGAINASQASIVGAISSSQVQAQVRETAATTQLTIAETQDDPIHQQNLTANQQSAANTAAGGGGGFNWGSIGSAFIGGAISLGLSALTASLNRRDEPPPPRDLEPVSPRGGGRTQGVGGGTTVVNNYGRTTIQAAPNPKQLARTVRQTLEDRNRRWQP